MNKKKKLILIIVISIIAALLIIGGSTTAIIVSNMDTNSNIKTLDIDDNQSFEYDGSFKSPKIKNLDSDDAKNIEYSYSKKTDDNPNDDEYTIGLPKDSGTYYVKTKLGEFSKITTLSIDKANLTLGEVNVIYNQDDILYAGSKYFTSDMDISSISFDYKFTDKNNKAIDGSIALEVTKLSPAISSYQYAFIPNDNNYNSYSGNVLINVYAKVSIYELNSENEYEIKDYDEVPYKSLFNFDYPVEDGYNKPYCKDSNGNIYIILKISSIIQLHII